VPRRHDDELKGVSTGERPSVLDPSSTVGADEGNRRVAGARVREGLHRRAKAHVALSDRCRRDLAVEPPGAYPCLSRALSAATAWPWMGRFSCFYGGRDHCW